MSQEYITIRGARENNLKTVIVIEHNQAIIKNADWIIDMGPEGGNKGGSPLSLLPSGRSYPPQSAREKHPRWRLPPQATADLRLNDSPPRRGRG